MSVEVEVAGPRAAESVGCPGRSSRYNRAAGGVIPRFGEPTEQRERERGTSGAVGPAGRRRHPARRARGRTPRWAALPNSLGADGGGRRTRAAHGRTTATPSTADPTGKVFTWHAFTFLEYLGTRLRVLLRGEAAGAPRDAGCPSADQPRPDPRNARSSFLENVEGYIGLLEAAGFRVEDVRTVRETCHGKVTAASAVMHVGVIEQPG